MIFTSLAKALTLGGIMFASLGYCGQKLNAVWSTSTFSTISGPDGGSSQSGYGAGFSLLKENGDVVYHEDYPAGYDPCANSNDSHGQAGATFPLTGGCFKEGGKFKFHCYSESLTPDHCKVFNKDWITVAESKGQDRTHFIGIAIGIDGYCGTSFELSDGVDCEPGVTGFVAKKQYIEIIILDVAQLLGLNRYDILSDKVEVYSTSVVVSISFPSPGMVPVESRPGDF